MFKHRILLKEWAKKFRWYFLYYLISLKFYIKPPQHDIVPIYCPVYVQGIYRHTKFKTNETFIDVEEKIRKKWKKFNPNPRDGIYIYKTNYFGKNLICYFSSQIKNVGFKFDNKKNFLLCISKHSGKIWENFSIHKFRI